MKTRSPRTVLVAAIGLTTVLSTQRVTAQDAGEQEVAEQEAIEQEVREQGVDEAAADDGQRELSEEEQAELYARRQAAMAAWDMFEKPKDRSEVAFEVYLRGRDDVPPLPVSIAEWDSLTGFMRSLAGIQDEGMFVTRQLNELLQQKSLLLAYCDQLDGIRDRVKEVEKQLERGMTFERAARLYSEDKNSGSVGGDFGQYAHGNLWYPLEPFAWGQEIGEVRTFMTRFATYMVKVVEKTPGATPLKDKIKIKIIWMGFGEKLNSKRRTQINRLLAVRSDHERFRRILPPALQDEASFGPTDIAPMGKPDTLLTEFSDDDARHGRIAPPENVPGAVSGDQPPKKAAASSDGNAPAPR